MKKSFKSTGEFAAVSVVIQHYFEGLYYADTQKLAKIFDSGTYLQAPGVRRSLNTWLGDVLSREVPAEIGQAYEFEIMAIDIVQDQAMVKIYCPLFEHQYIDFIGLLKEQGQWRIVSKMYTDIRRGE